MAVFEHLSSLLLNAEKSSANGPVAVDLFRRGEDSEAGAGLVPVWENSAPVGRVVAERGRICWVIAKGGDACLSDILARETGIERAEFEQIFKQARDDRIPFGEMLTRMGLVDADATRRTLRNQAATALAMLAQEQSREEFLYSVAPIRRISYNRDFTFGALELLQAAIGQSRQLKSELTELPRAFVRMAPKLQAAVCFRESDSIDIPLVPISYWSRGSMAIGEALELALAGIAATQPGSLFASDISPFAIIAPENSACWVSAYSDPYLCLFQIETQAQYLRVISTLLAENRGELEPV